MTAFTFIENVTVGIYAPLLHAQEPWKPVNLTNNLRPLLKLLLKSSSS